MTDFYDDVPVDDDVDLAAGTDPEYADEDLDLVDADKPKYHGSSADPTFGFLLAVAVSIGLTPILPENADLRYTLAWGVLALVGVLTWLLGSGDRIGQEYPENIGWGVGFGIMVSVPFMIFFLETFGQASRLIFPDFGNGTVLAYVVFVMPLAETLFFRGLLQQRLEFWLVGLLASIWSAILFFPVMWSELRENPAVAIFLLIALLTLNLMYSYVRQRNSLAAAWITQIVASVIVFFVPLL